MKQVRAIMCVWGGQQTQRYCISTKLPTFLGAFLAATFFAALALG